jgi:hypothetical protein
LACVGRADGDDLVGIEIVQRILAEEVTNGALYLRHARGAADHHHALDLGNRQTGVAQRLLDRLHGLGDQRLGDLGKDFGGQRQIDLLATVQTRVDLGNAVKGQVFLGFASARQEHPGILDRQGLESRRLRGSSRRCDGRNRRHPAPSRRPSPAPRRCRATV